MRTLAHDQHLLWQLVREPEGVAAGLDALPGGAARLAETVVSDDRLDAEARLGIYASAYFIRIHDVLADDFEALARALGADWFNDLVTSYLALHPPRHFSLREVGERLPACIAEDAALAPIRERWPFAADLARLEWALGRAFDAEDGARLAASDLAALAPEDFDGLALALDPAARLLELDWPVQRLLSEDASIDAGLPAERARLLVTRPEWAVQWRSLDDAEHAALLRVAAGTTFGEVCEIAADADGEAQGPATAAGWLARWLEAGAIARAAD